MSVSYHQYTTVNIVCDDTSALLAARVREEQSLTTATAAETDFMTPLLPFLSANIAAAKLIALNGRCHLVAVGADKKPVRATPEGEPLCVDLNDNLLQGLQALQVIETARLIAAGTPCYGVVPPKGQAIVYDANTSHYAATLNDLTQPRRHMHPVSGLAINIR